MDMVEITPPTLYTIILPMKVARQVQSGPIVLRLLARMGTLAYLWELPGRGDDSEFIRLG